MADEGEVLSKLEAFLVRHHHVSLVELDALISTVSSTDGISRLMSNTYGPSVNVDSLKVVWPLIAPKLEASGSNAVVEWMHLWFAYVKENVSSLPSSNCVALLSQLQIVVKDAASLSLVTSGEASKLKVLVQSVANLLQPIGVKNSRSQQVYSVVRRFLRLPGVFASAASLVAANTLDSLSSLVNVLTLHNPSSEESLSFRSKLVDLYCENVVSARTSPSTNTVAAFRSLLKEAISSAFLTDKIFPAIERMIPRTPDCLPHIASGLALISSSTQKDLDFATGSSKILAFVTEYIVSSSDASREHAQSIIRSLCTRISDEKAFTPLVEKLSALLNKQLNNWYERAGLFSALSCVAQTCPIALSLRSLFPLLVKNVEKEKNKDVVGYAVLALANWIALDPKQFLAQDSVLQVLAKGLADTTKDVVYMYLLHLYTAIAPLEDPTLNLALLSKPLLNFVVQAKTKAAFASEALLSLAVLQRLASIGMTDLIKAFETDKLWSIVLDACFKQTDVLVCINDVNKALNASNAHVPLIGLLKDAFIAFPTLREEKSFVAALGNVLAHESVHWRSLALKEFAKIHLESEEISIQFSSIVLTLLEAQLARNAAEKDEDLRSSPYLLVSMLHLATTPLLNKETEVPRLFVLACHPFLQGRAASKPLSLVTKPLQMSLDDLTSRYADAIMAYITSDKGLQSSDKYVVRSARSVVSRLLASSALSSRLVELVVPMLSYDVCKSWLSFTTSQVAIFHTPENECYARITLDDVSDASSHGGKDSKKKEVDEGKDAKKKAAEAKKKAMDLAMAKFQKQQSEAMALEKVSRDKVAPIHRALSHGLNIVHEAAQISPSVFSLNDAHFLTMIMDTIAQLTRYDTEFQFLASHALQWLVHHCFAKKKYLTSRDSHLVTATAKPADSDVQAQVVEDLDSNAKGAIDAASWAIFQSIAISAITPLTWIQGHGHKLNKEDKNRGNMESAHHVPRHVQELAFTAIDHNKKHISPSLTQCLLTALDSSPTFSNDARTALVESAPHFNFHVKPHIASLEILIQNLDHANAVVRLAVLDCLVSIPKLSHFGHHDEVSTRLWKARFDTEPDASDLAVSLYKAYSAEHPLTPMYWDFYAPLLHSQSSVVREMAAKAIVGAMNLHAATKEASLAKVLSLHTSHYVKPEETDASNPRSALSRSAMADVVSEGKDWHQYRAGAASVFSQFGQLAVLSDVETQRLFQFLISTALFESNIDIYKAFVDAGVQIITLQGARNAQIIATLITLFEEHLSSPAPSTPIQHRVREAVVIFLGTVVQHLPSSDKKVDAIIQRLMDVLTTPSEPVQQSVASCLEHIASRMPERATSLLQNCLQMTLAPGKGGYPHQRGGAWGLAGIVKGLNPISLHRNPFIVERIQAAFNNKQDIDARVGASLAIECFTATLSSGFEPWLLYFLPNIITGLGDGQIDVREVTLEAARVVMSQLSGNGVRLVLPSLLQSLDDNSGKWKAKVGAIELVGAMGHLQAQQLGQCLPQIVPRLSTLLADPHVQVQKVAKEALESICSSIHNPEVTKIVPILLKAIDDPKLYSGQALEHLSTTDFVNRIDNASLSLIMPVLDRALRERTSDTKRRATKIVGIMCNLTEPKALIPYQKSLSEQLKVVLADPQPVTRAMAAHALGQLVKGLDTASEIVPYLLETMKTPEVGMIERIGAAQGLAHVASHMEMQGFRTSLLPRILAMCDSGIPAARQGYLAVFQFLPDTLSSRFEPLMDVVLPVVLKGLSDEQDMVRESALAGGQAIVKCFGDEKVDVLVPVLRQGLFDKNWRIRASSIQLLGDLLYQISGASEDFANKDISKMLEGEERSSVLASLYLLRHDPMGAVASQAVSVWKMLVVNTPKTLKVLMPILMGVILKQLAAGEDEREVASETLVELVHKMGDRVLGDIIPILEKELDVSQSETRVGICIGLANVLEAVPRHHIAEYFDMLLPAITKALCDSASEVRIAAAGAFDGLYKGVGDRAVSECLPVLLARMEHPDHALSHSALLGVQQLLVLRSQLILPILLPKLTAIPLTNFNAKALASIAEVAGTGLTPFLSTIVPSLIKLKYTEPEGSANVPTEAELLTRALHAVVLSAEGSGLGILLNELSRFTSDSLPALRIAALTLLGLYASTKGKTTPKGWVEQISAIIGLALRSYHDRDANVVKSAIAALGDIMATIDPETVADSPVNYIQTINDTVESLHVPDTLEGFSAPGGLAPILPVFVAAMRNGNSELREQVSLGIRGMVSKTDSSALTPSVLQAIAGPLIRILSEPNLESRIRADILMTLNLLVQRGGENLKSFATTLQVTYIKAISSTFKATREQAAVGLGRLIGLGAKADFLIKALVPALKASAATKPEECLSAIAQVYKSLPADVMEATSTQIRDALVPFMEGASTSGHTQRSKAAEAMASTLRFLSPESAAAKLKALKLVEGAPSDLAEAGFLSVYHLLTLSPQFGAYLSQQDELIEDIKLGLSVGDSAFIRGAAGQALGYLLVYVDDSTVASEYARALAEALDEDESVDVKICVLNAIRQFAKASPGNAADLLSILVPAALQRVKKSILSLKYAAERALYHLLQVKTNPSLHQHFATTLPDSHTKTFLEFCKVVLSKLPEHSDDEEVYDDGYNE